MPPATSGRPIAVGDWVNISDPAHSDHIAVVIQTRTANRALYYKVIPTRWGGGRPFWVSAIRCRRSLPPQRNWPGDVTRHILRGDFSASPKRTEDTPSFPFMEDPGAQYFPNDRDNPFLASGDWIIFLDQENEECIGVVVDRKVTPHGVYLKIVPVSSGNRRPFWASAQRCSPIPPSGDGGL